MARRKKIVEAQDYTTLIETANNELKNLEENLSLIKEEIKNKKLEIKKLERDKVAYDEQLQKEEQERKIQEIAEKILESGKTLEEIELMLTK